jgi:hypothetical protein
MTKRMANAMAKPMANTMAKRWPDNRDRNRLLRSRLRLGAPTMVGNWPFRLQESPVTRLSYKNYLDLRDTVGELQR